jgi:two-component system phosphate regulon sensor histidine kinase PhoR
VAAESVRVSIATADGHRVMGEPPGKDQHVISRRDADSGLPWNLAITDAAASADAAAFAARRRLLSAALAALVILIPAGGYVVWRAVHKELAVARLKADFVSAVSHEFRTPLTSMGHLTERLQRDTSIPDDRKRQYYDALAHDTDRLRRFVETLLDFGRLEAGEATVRPEPSDLAAVVTDIVNEFRAERAGREIVVRLDAALPPVRLDREAFSRALWNLLDNAAKYSPHDSPINVELGQEAHAAIVRVADRGPGIPEAERRLIFQKFVRGADSKAAGIKGTGVGLALVDHLIRAHGGHVRLESAIGRGSTFSVVLPIKS